MADGFNFLGGIGWAYCKTGKLHNSYVGNIIAHIQNTGRPYVLLLQVIPEVFYFNVSTNINIFYAETVKTMNGYLRTTAGNSTNIVAALYCKLKCIAIF